MTVDATPLIAPLANAPLPQAQEEASSRVTEIFRREYDFVWRSLRRLGVPEAGVDDAAQDVFWVLARRQADVRVGAERSFLFATATRVASDARKKRSRCREFAPEFDLAETLVDRSQDPSYDLERARAREQLDRILDGLAMEQRAVFVLFELEGLSLDEIAELLAIPRGTAASRLRRARVGFSQAVARIRAAAMREEEQP